MTPYPRRSPLKAVRVFCVECQGESPQAVTECHDPACPFHAYRHGTPPDGEQHQPMKAIRQYCFDNCQAGAGRDEVINCRGDKAVLGPCPVFPFRLGVNPNTSAETRGKRREVARAMAVKGQFGFSKPMHQTPFDVPESTETGQAIL